MKSRRDWLLALPGVVALLVYLPVLGHGLVWDDVPFLRDHPLYRVPELWRQAVRQHLGFSSNYFRPLAVLTLIGEMRLGGDTSPAIFHLTNLILHVANTVLVTLLARHLALSDARQGKTVKISSGAFLAPVVAGLFYGLHPALVEGVSFVSCRFDLLLTTFLLLALLADAKLPRAGIVRPLGVGLAFLLAALSKEMAVAMVLVLPLWHLALGRRQRGLSKASGNLTSYAALLVAGGVYLALRRAALGYVLLPQTGIATGNALQHVLLVARSFIEYLIIVVWPFTTLTPLHVTPLPIPLHDAFAWASLAALVALIAGLVKLTLAAPRSGALLAAGFLSLLPVANVLPLDLGGGAFVAERFLVFPLALLALGTVPLLQRVALRRPRQGWVFAGLWFFAAIVTIERTLPHWRNDLTLWTWGAGRAPRSGTPPANLARWYAHEHDSERCLAAARRAIELDPRAHAAWNLAGHALMALGRYAEAQTDFEQAVRLAPKSGLYWNNVAGSMMEQKQYETAERVLIEEALPRDPMEPATRLNLGIVYVLTERPALAVPHFREALRLVTPAERGGTQALLDHALSGGGATSSPPP